MQMHLKSILLIVSGFGFFFASNNYKYIYDYNIKSRNLTKEMCSAICALESEN